MPRHALQHYDALLHEDLITPVHDHRPGHDHLLADIDGTIRRVSPRQAGDLTAARRPYTELVDECVEHHDDGPRGVRRRDVLVGAGAGLGALLGASAAPRYSFAASTTPRDLLIAVFLRGGFDGLSAVVPTGDAAYYAARPTIGIKAASTTPLAKGYGLHSAFAPLLPAWSAGELAIVPHVGHPWITRSHFDDQVSAERSALPSQRSGWIARHLQTSSAATGTFRGITFGDHVTTSMTATAFDTVAMSTVEDMDFTGWNGNGSRDLQRAAIARWYKDAGGMMATQAQTTLSAIDGLARLRATEYTPAAGAGYPETRLGRGMREIARVAKGSVGLEAACIDSGTWDMHVDLAGAGGSNALFAQQAADLASSLAALRTDLGSVWARTTVVTMSEFGRRVAENGDRGLDHGNGTTMFLLGGGIRGGVYGSASDLGADHLTAGAVPVLTDFRQPLSEVVSHRLANAASMATVFPGFTPGTSLGVTR